MKQMIEDYLDAIKQLPVSSKYKKEELLTPNFLIEAQEPIEIYYAPHNEYLNPQAKVFIVGITPGFEQMSTAIAEARQCLIEEVPIEETQYRCKVAGRFSGSLRQNLIKMLEDLNLGDYLNISHASQLFDDCDELLHTISLIPYPVFVKGKNYTGHSPKLLKSPFLMKYVYENFMEEFHQLQKVLIIPLGKGVEEVLLHLAKEGLLNEDQILKGFPHPSGANAHRFKQFEEHKHSMIRQIEYWFNTNQS